MTSPIWRSLGQVVFVYFAVGGAAVTAQETQPGRATFAEMIAFARLASVPCQRLAPDADSFHALALRRLIQPPINEEEIAAKEKDIKRLRVRLGLSRWCKRYAGQMEQARILVQVLRRQNSRALIVIRRSPWQHRGGLLIKDPTATPADRRPSACEETNLFVDPLGSRSLYVMTARGPRPRSCLRVSRRPSRVGVRSNRGCRQFLGFARRQRPRLILDRATKVVDADLQMVM
jgi:hypothetical protein